MGQLRVGHNRRRIAVDQDDFEAFFFEHLAGLCAGIIELTGLADDNRPGTYYQYLLDILALRHNFI